MSELYIAPHQQQPTALNPEASAREFVRDYLHQKMQPLSQNEITYYKSKIKEQLKAMGAVLIAHYYTDPLIQELADETGGCVSDSLEMARFGRDHEAQTLIVAGVKFMGETAKILSPEKRVLMPTLDATCSLDIGCPIEAFKHFCDQHPDRQVVVYANTSAAVKARADWVVTSGCAVDIVTHLTEQGQKLIWAPDRYLGSYIQANTDADMILWDAACIVHEEFKAQGVLDLKKVYPDAAVLVHPESPASVVALADVVGSTSQIIAAAQKMPNDTFIVATDKAIFYKMQQFAPGKRFIEAPTAGAGATCRSCAHCPWMAMNGLENLLEACIEGKDEVFVDPDTAVRAMLPLRKMLDFTSTKQPVQPVPA